MAIRLERKEESEEEESEEEGGEGAMTTEGIGERIRAERDEEKVKRMNDPRKPTVQLPSVQELVPVLCEGEGQGLGSQEFC